MAFPITN